MKLGHTQILGCFYNTFVQHCVPVVHKMACGSDRTISSIYNNTLLYNILHADMLTDCKVKYTQFKVYAVM